MDGQIFISYRRDDSSSAAGRIYDRLDSRFAANHIFYDVDNLDLGVDFVEEIEKSVGSCDVLIAVIGKHWLMSSDEEGRRRLDDPEDFVRIEIATALKRGVRVIPVLVDGASMPRPGDLPDDLKPLVRRNALDVSHTRFTGDCARLIAALEQVLEGARAEQPNKERGSDLRYDMQITLEEAGGCEKEIEIRKLDACEACQGTGRVIEKPCRTCHGDGRVKLKIPAGIDEGARLRSAGGGEAGLRNGTPGDLYVVIHIKEHAIFLRHGMDLHCEIPVPFSIAALGGEVRVPTLTGAVNLKIPPARRATVSSDFAARECLPCTDRATATSSPECKCALQRLRNAGERLPDLLRCDGEIVGETRFFTDR